MEQNLQKGVLLHREILIISSSEVVWRRKKKKKKNRNISGIHIETNYGRRRVGSWRLGEQTVVESEQCKPMKG